MLCIAWKRAQLLKDMPNAGLNILICYGDWGQVNERSSIRELIFIHLVGAVRRSSTSLSVRQSPSPTFVLNTFNYLSHVSGLKVCHLFSKYPVFSNIAAAVASQTPSSTTIMKMGILFPPRRVRNFYYVVVIVNDIVAIGKRPTAKHNLACVAEPHSSIPFCASRFINGLLEFPVNFMVYISNAVKHNP